ncbi:prion-inhibition and propagation, helo domain-containing protein [Aspergillus granulosus]|uniref:Prion-inhibition and propagation, helo domain-containing protein n=1 Tax=Aspergillus granulosus TaxID=176169 RepID=A0ABR4H8U8_9EURO
MEPAGLAVGILGLASLFNTCLDALEKFDTWRDFAAESRSIATQFKVQRLRLENWGNAVGFEQGVLLNKHSKFLDDPRTLLIVQELLSAIRDIRGYDGETLPTRAPDTSSNNGQMSKIHSHTPIESKRIKLSWVLRDKARCIAQVEQISMLVENLHSLVPINGASSGYGSDDCPDGPSRRLDVLLGRELGLRNLDAF